MAAPAVAAMNAVRDKPQQGLEGSLKDVLSGSMPMHRGPRKDLMHSGKDEVKEPLPENSFAGYIDRFVSKRILKRSPITPWMVDGTFKPDQLVGAMPPVEVRLREGQVFVFSVSGL